LTGPSDTAGRQVVWTGIGVNILLIGIKFVAGIAGHSHALIADAIHSISDLFTDGLVLFGMRIGGKPPDDTHHFGHARIETLAASVVGMALMATAVFIGFESARNIYFHTEYHPNRLALAGAAVSIVFKELLYHYTIYVGRRINSRLIIANAWHHRSDAFSSVGTALGISGAILLGEKWRVLDPIAGIIVSFFILKVAWDIAHPSIRELLEEALPDETEEVISGIIRTTPGVKDFHQVRTRKIGDIIAIEAHVKVDKTLTVVESHHIATAIEKSIRAKFGRQTHIGIHIEPYNERAPEYPNDTGTLDIQ
jgi:cation diffusion facilitator family transporter